MKDLSLVPGLARRHGEIYVPMAGQSAVEVELEVTEVAESRVLARQ